MKVNRKKTYLGKMPKNDEGFVDLLPAERISFMWELAAELWLLRKSPCRRRIRDGRVWLSPGRKKDKLDLDYLKRAKSA